MHIDLPRNIAGIIGFILSWKLSKLIFSTDDKIMAIIIPIILLLFYSIQSTTWDSKSSFSIFGIKVYRSSKIKQQYRIFGIIPISRVITINTERALFDNKKDAIKFFHILIDVLLPIFPFGGLINKGGNILYKVLGFS